MSDSAAVLRLDDVSVGYRDGARTASVVSHVSLEIPRGEIFGLVGESGCGKTTLSLATMGLLPTNAGVEGSIELNGRSLEGLSAEERRDMRGREVAMVVQDPLTSLDPTYPVGAQLVEAIRVHRSVSRSNARAEATVLLRSVGIPDAERRMKDPPHRFSGGMRQRAVIAMALANDPALLIADEPTTALDVTIQDQILTLIRGLRDKRGMAVLLITHDLAVVAKLCDRVGVMYAGKLVEVATTTELFRNPRHPYTQALLAALPSAQHRPGELAVIPGGLPNPFAPPAGCRYMPRCPHAMEVCETEPALEPATARTAVACWLRSSYEQPAPPEAEPIGRVHDGN